MIKFDYKDRTHNDRMYASDDLPNLDKKGKPYLMDDGYGIVLPWCPFCNEPAYESTHCVFCGAEFEKLTKEEKEEQKLLNNELTVTYGNVLVHQVSNSVWVFRDNALLCHVSLAHPYTEDELIELAETYVLKEER